MSALRQPQVVFENTILRGTGKKGIIKPDADGYYAYNIGAIGVDNYSGEAYDYQAGKKAFSNSLAFMRKANSGKLYGERGHPVITSNMADVDVSTRLSKILESNICVHYRKIVLTDTIIKGKPASIVSALIKPMDVKTKASFDNPHENVCFSIRSRCLRSTNLTTGKVTKYLTKVITFDLVDEGGISVATKYDSPTLESIDSISFGVDEIRVIVAQSNGDYTTEEVSILKDILKEVDSAMVNIIKPISHTW